MISDFKLNDKVNVMNDINGIISSGTIIGIEPDDEYDFNWLYLLADEQELNTIFEQKLNGYIWRIIPDIDSNIAKKEDW